MIRESDGTALQLQNIDDPFFIRIKSLYDCYSTDYDFVRFYTQYAGERAVSFLSLFEGRMNLFLTADSDLPEIESFVSFSGCVYVMFNADFLLNFNSLKEISGDVLKYQKRSKTNSDNVIEPDVSSIYEVLKSSESEDFIVPDYLVFLSDMTHRKNKGKCTARGIIKSDKLISCAMAVSESDNAVIIGAVATRPEYRCQGFSRRVVISLSEKYAAQNQSVYVFSANKKNTRFYENSGFETAYHFREIQIG